MSQPPAPPTPLQQAQADYQAGKLALEGGRYQRSIDLLEAAMGRINPNSALGGEVQITLVMAYEAGGYRQEARDLCRRLEKHWDPEIRKQGSQILYILEAPRLETRPDWVVPIPDLSQVETGDLAYTKAAGTPSPPKPSPRIQPAPPLDPSQINTQDNQFVRFALGCCLVLLLAFGLGILQP